MCIFNDKLNSWINFRNSQGTATTFLVRTMVMILISVKSVGDSPQTLLWAESKTFWLTILKESGCEKIICIFPHCHSWKHLFYIWYGIFQALPALKPIVHTCSDSSAEIITVRNNNVCIAMSSFTGLYYLNDSHVSCQKGSTLIFPYLIPVKFYLRFCWGSMILEVSSNPGHSVIPRFC